MSLQHPVNPAPGRRRLHRWACFALGLGLAAAMAPSPQLAHADPDSDGTDRGADVSVGIPGEGSTTVKNGQFRWGLNNETGSGAFYGQCNFLSAGKVGDTHGGKVWTADMGYFAATDGEVSIEKSTTEGDTIVQAPMSWDQRCTDAEGTALSSSDFRSSGVQAVIDGGTGSIDPETNSAQISWEGSVTVVFYGGLTYWWLSDPQLSVEGGRGEVTATLGGYGTSMDDMTQWDALPETKVVLADLEGVEVAESGGFATVPEYAEVSIDTPSNQPAQSKDSDNWGSFPQSFVDFQYSTGQGAYWYSSGGIRDAAKPATTLYISYDAERPISTDPDADAVGGTGDGTGGGLLGGGTNGALGDPLDASANSSGGSGSSVPLGDAPPLDGDDGDSPTTGDFSPAWASLPTQGLHALRGLMAEAASWFADPRNRLLGLSGVALGSASALFLGLRQGWLTLPWRRLGGS